MVVDSQSLDTLRKNHQPEKSESHLQCQPEILDAGCHHHEVKLSRGELLRSKPTRGQIGTVKRLQHRHLYIGRGAPHLGCLRSLWANPFKVKEFGREAAIQKFETMLKSSTDLQQKLHQLSDKVLLCHCDPSEACHGDVLISAWEDKFLAGNASGAEDETAQAEELFRAAAMRPVSIHAEASSNGSARIPRSWMPSSRSESEKK